jgi:glycosyltransferase involved in cell wall biosynthesis
VKIAVISSLFAPFAVGGAEQVAAQMAETFRLEGHEVDVISTCRRQELTGQSYRVDLWNGLRVWRIAPWNVYWRVDQEQPRPKDITRAAWHLVDLWNPSVIRPLQKVFCQIAPDVVNTHNIDGFSPVVWQVARKYASVVVHTLHDYHLLCPRAVMRRMDGKPCLQLCTGCQAYAAYHRLFQGCVDAVISPSRAAADLHKSAGWGRSSTSVIPNAVDVADVVPPESTAGSPLQIVFMSRLVPEKGCDALLAIIEQFRDCRDIHFHVAGTGPFEQHFARLAEDALNVTWHGYVTGTRKSALLSAGDVFLQLSEWPENAPLALLEAKQFGMYLVGTNLGGIPELITNPLEGRLIEPADPAGLQAVLRDQIADRGELRAQRPARLNRSHGYGVREMGRRYLDVFSSAC